MNKDKALEELFLAHKPHFYDSDVFMASLSQRLDAVEYIKQHQEATLRRYKLAMVVAFVVGLVVGGIAIAYTLSAPMDVPVFSFRTQFTLLQWVCVNSRFITVAVLSLLMTFGITAFIYNIQDIKTMHTTLAQSKI